MEESKAEAEPEPETEPAAGEAGDGAKGGFLAKEAEDFVFACEEISTYDAKAADPVIRHLLMAKTKGRPVALLQHIMVTGLAQNYRPQNIPPHLCPILLVIGSGSGTKAKPASQARRPGPKGKGKGKKSRQGRDGSLPPAVTWDSLAPPDRAKLVVGAPTSPYVLPDWDPMAPTLGHKEIETALAQWSEGLVLEAATRRRVFEQTLATTLAATPTMDRASTTEPGLHDMFWLIERGFAVILRQETLAILDRMKFMDGRNVLVMTAYRQSLHVMLDMMMALGPLLLAEMEKELSPLPPSSDLTLVTARRRQLTFSHFLWPGLIQEWVFLKHLWQRLSTLAPKYRPENVAWKEHGRTMRSIRDALGRLSRQPSWGPPGTEKEALAAYRLSLAECLEAQTKAQQDIQLGLMDVIAARVAESQ